MIVGRYTIYGGSYGGYSIDTGQMATDAGLADRLWYRGLRGLRRVMAASTSLYTSRIIAR